MDAARVRGILPMNELVPLTGVQRGLLGLATLKGQTIAVLDLRHRLGLPRARPGPQPKIVVFDVAAGDECHTAGFLADRVSDVVIYRPRDLHNGVLRGRGRPRRLLDLDQIVKEADLLGLACVSP
jgi:chemotaxis signal transduction protein